MNLYDAAVMAAARTHQPTKHDARRALGVSNMVADQLARHERSIISIDAYNGGRRFPIIAAALHGPRYRTRGL